MRSATLHLILTKALKYKTNVLHYYHCCPIWRQIPWFSYMHTNTFDISFLIVLCYCLLRVLQSCKHKGRVVAMWATQSKIQFYQHSSSKSRGADNQYRCSDRSLTQSAFKMAQLFHQNNAYLLYILIISPSSFPFIVQCDSTEHKMQHIQVF